MIDSAQLNDVTAEPTRGLKSRDRAATELRIVAAVGEALSVDGFGSLGINAIAKLAGVDKVLIYRYFGGLPELLKAYGQSGTFWPRISDLLGEHPQQLLSLPLAQRYSLFFGHFIDELRKRPLTLAILSQELRERNELTIILENERERWGSEVAEVLDGTPDDQATDVLSITLLLIAGVQYLLMRSRTIRTFGGVDVRADAGWDQLKAGISAMAAALLHDNPPMATRKG